MRRREFITLLGGAAAAWPLSSSAQQLKRRIGAVIARLENDPVGQAEIAALFDNLRQLGWTAGVGGNIQVDYRWTGSDLERIRAGVAEIVCPKLSGVTGSLSPGNAFAKS
jgi:putative ABC transport system substrate-binding protein